MVFLRQYLDSPSKFSYLFFKREDMEKLKGAQQRFTGVVEAGVLTIWERMEVGQPRERTPSVLLIDPKTDPRQSLDGGRLDRGGRARHNRCTL